MNKIALDMNKVEQVEMKENKDFSMFALEVVGASMLWTE
jgi:hypothetical protein